MYQLYRTTTKLSGNVCVDVILKREEGNIVADSMYLSTINTSTPSSYKVQNMSDSFSSFLKRIYKDVGRDIYKQQIDPVYYDYSVFTEDIAKKYDVRPHNYDNGLQRAVYNKYNKQFSILTPLYINNKQDIEKDIDAKLCLTSMDGKNTIYSTTSVKFNDIYKNFLNSFLKNCWFSEDSRGVEVHGGNEININKGVWDVIGYDVETGNIVKNNNKYCLLQLIDREKLLLELDSALTGAYENNNLIYPNILNIRWFFNLEDIFIESFTYNNYYKDRLNILCNINDAPWKDLSSCYDHNFSIDYTDKEGVRKTIQPIDYLQDDRNINLIYTNKISPYICRWAYCGTESYIYNLYNGFADPLSETGTYLCTESLSEKLTTIQNINDIANSETGIQETNPEFYTDDIIDTLNESNKIYKYNPAHPYIQYLNLNWNIKAIIEESYLDLSKNNYILILGTDYVPEHNTTLINKVTQTRPYTTVYNNLVIIYINSKSYEDGKSMINSSYTDIDKYIIRNSYVKLSNKLTYYGVPTNQTPSINTTEIEHYINQDQITLTRLDCDYISPYLVDEQPTYYKRVIKDSDTLFRERMKQDWDPKYPSINYYTLTEEDERNNDYICEYSRFKKNAYYNLIPSFDLYTDSENLTSQQVYESFKDYYKKYFGNIQDNIIEYFYNLYNYTYSFDYINETNIKIYRYKITFVLK